MDLNKLFRNIPETIVVVSPEYKILEATDAYLETTMRTRDELIGQNFLEVFPDNPASDASKNVSLLRQSLDNALHTKKIDYLEVLRYDIPKPEALGGGFDIRYWEASHTPVLDDEGNVEFIIQRTSDVTEREIARLALSESEDKFRFMAEAMPQLVHTSNPDGDFTYLNQRTVNYTGLPLKELVGSGWQQIIHPDDLLGVLERWGKAKENGVDFQTEVRIRDKDGNYRWHLVRSTPMRDEKGTLIMRIGSSVDIHDSRLMVQELLDSNEQMAQLSDQVQKAYEKAEAERRLLKDLIMKAPAFCCVLKGPEHRFELVNQNYQNMFPNRDLLHKPVDEALPEVLDQGVMELLDNVFNTGEEFVVEELPFKIYQPESGQYDLHYLTFIYQPIVNENNKITGILVFGHDVTERVIYRQKLQALTND
ncbi:PAS domain-containing protein [Pontibacter vulgaris]|uniref:PAS domain-containing protein n=1 Tax=Pontibacter vulgaris TaxID=2905679 RepID=UPI001FA736B8|nr:PAS domain-containing protein [Pontibacter vulgaris]